MRIHFALELPTVALELLNGMADLDFAIAYRVLQDDVYARHYARRTLGRTLILDNGFHELGKPAGWPELLDADSLVDPDYIIVPDNRGPYDAEDNLHELQRALEFTPAEKLAVVVAGTTPAERATMVQAALDLGVGMLCLSRMVDRLQWFRELCVSLPMVAHYRIHLLGVSSLDELELWQASETQVSVDTSKPAKAALLGKSILANGQSLRGMPVVSKTLFEQPMDTKALELCRRNIGVLRTACGG